MTKYVGVGKYCNMTIEGWCAREASEEAGQAIWALVGLGLEVVLKKVYLESAKVKAETRHISLVVGCRLYLGREILRQEVVVTWWQWGGVCQ